MLPEFLLCVRLLRIAPRRALTALTLRGGRCRLSAGGATVPISYPMQQPWPSAPPLPPQGVGAVHVAMVPTGAVGDTGADALDEEPEAID